jgi:N-acetylglucosamine kinase-like BadF-type ATPase
MADLGRTFLGVDGGQTGSRAVLVDATGQVISRAQAGGLIHALEPRGDELLRIALTDLRDQTMLDGRPPDVVFMGLTAIVPGTASEPVGVAIAAEVWPDSQRILDGDGYIAWAGATGGAPGVVAMAGTGSVVEAVNERGERVETGGWAYLFGDPGSGWDIGSTAVRRMLQRWDRDQSVSAVGQVVLAGTHSQKPPEVPDRVYSREIDYVEVARLAEPITGLALAGDPEAIDIVTGAAVAFAADAAAAIGRLNWEREPVLVATLGRIFHAGDLYGGAFLRALEGLTPRRFRRADPVLTGLGGSALLALKAGGIEPGPEIVATLIKEGLGGEDA